MNKDDEYKKEVVETFDTIVDTVCQWLFCDDYEPSLGVHGRVRELNISRTLEDDGRITVIHTITGPRNENMILDITTFVKDGRFYSEVGYKTVN